MNKFTCACAAVAAALSLISFPLAATNSKTAFAERVTSDTKKLEYFELKAPVSAVRDGESVHIAEKGKIVTYRDGTYDTTAANDLEISKISKIGDYLLVLSGDSLSAFNPSTGEFKQLAGLNGGVAAFSVSGTDFAVSHKTNPDPAIADPAVIIYELTDAQNFAFSKKTEYKPTGANAPNSLALTDNGEIFYCLQNSAETLIYKQVSNVTTKYSANFQNLSCLSFDGGSLYFFADGYLRRMDAQTAQFHTECNLSDLGCPQAASFFVSGDKALLCDQPNDRVIEYSLSQNALTDFEISFTKIDLPENFDFEYSANLFSVQITPDDEIYEIDLDCSLTGGYFTYKGYHSPATSREYLIAATIGDDYYLIAGDVMALIIKSDEYTVTPVQTTTKNTEAFATSAVSAYKLPALESFKNFSASSAGKFVNFNLQKSQRVTAVCSFEINSVNYSLILANGEFGYVPTSFLTNSLFVPEQKTQFTTAVLWHEPVPLYSDEALTDKIAELPARTEIAVYERKGDVCYVRDENGNKGYIQASCIRGSSYYKLRAASIAVIAALALTVTAVYLESRFLYAKKKR